ncbi:MAG TPA: ABC transporter ATP-binding protein, partial [bacterium]|nr:ABC transporter ATP-binding protein [bacterium]
IADLAYSYAGRTPVRALDGVTLAVLDNEFLAIVGPVGCGKTTLLRCVAGLLQPARGTITCDRVSVVGPSPQRGFVFQEQSLFPWMTVTDNLAFGLQAQGVEASRQQGLVDEMIGVLGLRGFERAYPKDLSGGMVKMVEVARVLIVDPALLLLDEPFGLLDAQTRVKMQDVLIGLWEGRRKTVILVTHDIEEAVYLADRVVIFSSRPGRVKADVHVDFPRPRRPGIRYSAAFLDVKKQVWDKLEAASEEIRDGGR